MNHDILVKEFRSYLKKILQEHDTDYVKNLFTEIFPALEKEGLEILMQHFRFNQSATARVTGYSRNCVIDKLKLYFGSKYAGKSEWE